MLLQTLGSLILVAGISYHLVTASWQVVLLSFVVAGVGYAAWIVRKALRRRAKIKALWRRSIEIDEMLHAVDRDDKVETPSPYYTRPVVPERRTNKTCVAFDGPAKSSSSNAKLNSDDALNTLFPDGNTHVVKAPAGDPSTRIYKFSMKALADSREKTFHQQQVPV